MLVETVETEVNNYIVDLIYVGRNITILASIVGRNRTILLVEIELY